MHENRKHERSSVEFSCTLTVGEESRKCEIQDLSASGAKVRVKGALEIGTVVTLELDRFGSFSADVVRVEKSLVGLKFQRSSEDMMEVVMAISGLV
ncbi:MAG: PilZ domain-containing protein [Rhodospirillaceae bacterium]|nr:PilZ domain-containing protein [Rhodospirillaceae bacterium]